MAACIAVANGSSLSEPSPSSDESPHQVRVFERRSHPHELSPTNSTAAAAIKRRSKSDAELVEKKPGYDGLPRLKEGKEREGKLYKVFYYADCRTMNQN